MVSINRIKNINELTLDKLADVYPNKDRDWILGLRVHEVIPEDTCDSSHITAYIKHGDVLQWFDDYTEKKPDKATHVIFLVEFKPWHLEVVYDGTSFRRYQFRVTYYYDSDEWCKIRRQVMKRDGNRCMICNSSRNLTVHHRTYIRFGQEGLDDLTTICYICHGVIHKSYISIEGYCDD